MMYSRRLSAALLLTTALIPVSAGAADLLPSGGAFTAGAGAIAATGDTLTVTQSSQAGVIAWDSFSIGAGQRAHFDNGDGATLNRVTGAEPSRIDGALTATGSLYLVNPGGVFVGPAGNVLTGGTFVASTQDVADAEFLAGGALNFMGDSAASVVNLGVIESGGGDVALIARRVENSGRIAAPDGAVMLGAGFDLTMADVGDARLSVRVGGADTAAVNSGIIEAASVEMRAQGGNVYALAGNTDAVVKATQADTRGGRIWLTAGDSGAVEMAGALDASGADGGAVDITAGRIDLSGAIDASATAAGGQGGRVMAIAADRTDFSGRIDAVGGAGGAGGFVETSAARVTIADDARVTTLAEGAAAGEWLIDPQDYRVFPSGGDITGAALSANLQGGNVTLESVNGGVAGNGDILIYDDVSWSANTTLTLNAERNIEFGKDVTATGASAGIALNPAGGDYIFAGGAITLSGASAAFSVNGTSYTLIHDVADLQAIPASSTGSYALAQDIDATATAGWNAGAGFAPLADFQGVLAGLNHAIDGLTINRLQTQVGLFGSLFGTLRDTTLSNVMITASGNTSRVGGAVGFLINGAIFDVHVTGRVSGFQQVGGLVGVHDQGLVSRSSSAATVSGATEVGGLVGLLRAATVSNSYAVGSVTASGAYAGGLVGGSNLGGSLIDVYASGAVSGASEFGGLIGGAVLAGAVTATNAYWDTDTTGQATSYAGTGIANANAYSQATYTGFDFTNVWYQFDGNLRPMLRSEASTSVATPHQLQLMRLDATRNYRLAANLDMTAAFTADGSGRYADVWLQKGFLPLITTAEFDGGNHSITGLRINQPGVDTLGLFGSVASGAVVKDLNLIGGSVTGRSYLGSVSANLTGTLQNVRSSMTVTGTGTYVGGLVGRVGNFAGLLSGQVTGSSATGAVSGVSFVGGLAGWVAVGGVTESFATGRVTGSGNAVGGLAGMADAPIQRSYATGDVQGADIVGGLVGDNYAPITAAYATGAVTATSGTGRAGGLTGANGASLSQTYATGLVTGQIKGGLIGYAGAGSSVTAGYWNTQTTGVATDAGGATARTTAQMQGTLPAGFNAAIWGTGTGLYPYFNWNYATTPIAVSGLAYSDAGVTPAAGVRVNALSGAALAGGATTGANGYFYILKPANTLNTAGVLAYLDGGAVKGGVYTDNVNAAGLSGLNIYGPSLNLVTGAGALSTTLTGLNATQGAYSDTDLNFFNPLSTKVTFDGYDLYLNPTVAAFTLNGNLTSGRALTLGGAATYTIDASRSLTAAGRLTLGRPVSWAGAYSLSLQTTGANDVQIDGAISGANGDLNLSAVGGVIRTGASGSVAIGDFNLLDGSWNQLAASLPAFSANSFVTNPAASTFLRATGGNGSPATPYLLSDIYGVQGMSSLTLLSSNFALTADIDASGTSAWNGGAGFRPIGETGSTFSGALNGQNRTITGLTIATAARAGLFGDLSGNVSNLTLANANVRGTEPGTLSAWSAGILAGHQSGGAITNVATSGTITTTKTYYAGGIVGFQTGASALISQSRSSAAVTIDDTTTVGRHAGGLVGAAKGAIRNSFATGPVRNDLQGAAGLVGLIDPGGSVRNSYATGATTGLFAGGLAAVNFGTVDNTYATGAVTASSTRGGLIASEAGGTTTNSFWDTQTTGQASSAGGVGRTTAQMRTLSTFAGAGWSIDDSGGTASIWRIYEGYTSPLLRSFLTPLTVTVDSKSKTYDGAAFAGGYTATYSNPAANPLGTLGGNLSSTVNAGSHAIRGLYSGPLGYDITWAGGGLTISPRAITVTAEAKSRAYGDANPALTWTVGGAGLAGSDSLSGALATTATTGSGVGAYGITQNTLTAGANYTITYNGANLTVTPRALSVTAEAKSRIYGDANPALTWTSSGLVNGDSLSGALATAATTGSGVGAYGITRNTLTAGANYTITYNGANLTVSPRALSVTADAKTRVYGDANPALTWTSSGLTNGDSLTGALATAATTASGVGAYGITQNTLTAGANYTITYNGANLTVTPRALSVTADAKTRVYGDANPALTWTSSGLVNGDSLTGALATAAAATSNIGTYGVAQGTLTAGANYTITYNGANLTVTPRALTATVQANDKVYDGAVAATGIITGLDGVVFNDDVSAAGTGSFTFADPNAGSNKAVAVSGLSLTGAAAGNYTLSPTGASSAAITPAPLNVAADGKTRIYGEANPALTYRSSGFVAGEGAGLFTGALTAGAGAASDVGAYAIGRGTLSAGPNYALVYSGANLTITPRPLSVLAEDAARMAGEANPVFAYRIGGMGLVNGDALQGALATPADGDSPAGAYAIVQGSLTAGANYALTVTPATLTVTPAIPGEPSTPEEPEQPGEPEEPAEPEQPGMDGAEDLVEPPRPLADDPSAPDRGECDIGIVGAGDEGATYPCNAVAGPYLTAQNP